MVQRRKPELFAEAERVREDDGGLCRRRRATEAATCVREATGRAEDSASGPAHGCVGFFVAPGAPRLDRSSNFTALAWSCEDKL